jgi:general secretion pathway protein I
MKQRRGFSLLEVLVATVIMGIAVTGLIVGLSNAVRNASRLTGYDRAAMLARTKMNDLLLDTDLPFDGVAEGVFERDQTGGVPSGWRAVVKPFDIPPNAGPGTVILQEISLQLWWEPSSGKRREIEADGYRQSRIPVPQMP